MTRSSTGEIVIFFYLHNTWYTNNNCILFLRDRTNKPHLHYNTIPKYYWYI